MKNRRNFFFLALGFAVGFALTGRSAETDKANVAAFASPSGLVARLADHSNIDLWWKYTATAPGGAWVEFTTPGDDFVKLDAVWPDVTTYHHPDVAPETRFVYRIHPFFGKPSKVVNVTTGHAAKPTEEEGPLNESAKTNSTNAQKSIRAVSTFDEAAPGNVSVTLSQPTSAVLRWEDRASDEDGYLVEVSADPEKDFKICALLPPNTTSFRKVELPAEMKCYFRVRAFFYGECSNTASVSTPSAAPRLKPEVTQKPEHNP
jgi:hypothetical protein